MTDNTARITIKIGETTIEVEGTEAYVDGKLKEPDSFDKLITKVSGTEKPVSSGKKEKLTVKKERKARKPSRVESYAIVKDLTLIAEGDKPSLKQFYTEKNPKTNYERNVVFCYYLLNTKEIKPIGINHIYTCYKEVKQRVGSISVSLSETSRKGWLDTSEMDDIKLTIRGEGYVEHDLPKVKKGK